MKGRPWKLRLFVALLVCGSLWGVYLAQAQPSPEGSPNPLCGSIKTIDQALRLNLGQNPADSWNSRGIRNGAEVSINLVFYKNEETRTTTIVRIIGDEACVVAAGNRWVSLRGDPA